MEPVEREAVVTVTRIVCWVGHHRWERTDFIETARNAGLSYYQRTAKCGRCGAFSIQRFCDLTEKESFWEKTDAGWNVVTLAPGDLGGVPCRP